MAVDVEKAGRPSDDPDRDIQAGSGDGKCPETLRINQSLNEYVVVSNNLVNN